jgi:hypothetical protein
MNTPYTTQSIWDEEVTVMHSFVEKDLPQLIVAIVIIYKITSWKLLRHKLSELPRASATFSSAAKERKTS